MCSRRFAGGIVSVDNMKGLFLDRSGSLYRRLLDSAPERLRPHDKHMSGQGDTETV